MPGAPTVQEAMIEDAGTSVVVQAYKPSFPGRLKQEDHNFEVCLDKLGRLGLQRKKGLVMQFCVLVGH